VGLGVGGGKGGINPDNIALSGKYDYSNKEQIDRATVGSGTIIVRSEPGAGLAGLNRALWRAQEITKNEKVRTKVYIDSTALKELMGGFEGTREGFKQLGENVAKLLDAISPQAAESLRATEALSEKMRERGVSEDSLNSVKENNSKIFYFGAQLEQSVEKYGSVEEMIEKMPLEEQIQLLNKANGPGVVIDTDQGSITGAGAGGTPPPAETGTGAGGTPRPAEGLPGDNLEAHRDQCGSDAECAANAAMAQRVGDALKLGWAVFAATMYGASDGKLATFKTSFDDINQRKLNGTLGTDLAAAGLDGAGPFIAASVLSGSAGTIVSNSVSAGKNIASSFAEAVIPKLPWEYIPPIANIATNSVASNPAMMPGRQQATYTLLDWWTQHERGGSTID
jgi:hypothetical protein